jgi:hypothetical protein
MIKCKDKQSEEVRQLEIYKIMSGITYNLDTIDSNLNELEDRLDPVLRDDDGNSDPTQEDTDVNTPLGKDLLSFNIHLSNIQKSLDNITTRLEI